MLLLLLQLASQEVVKLPEVSFKNSKSLYQALLNRKSTRDYKKDASLSEQDLSDILWAAGGINRKEEGKYTVPAANNKLNIITYVILKSGIYRYQPKEHQLLAVAKGDHRTLAGNQDFSHVAPLNIVFVADYTDDDRPPMYAGMHVGSMMQNVYLAAADKNLATIARAYVDKDKLGKALKLRPRQEVLLAQTVGPFQ